MRIALAMLAVLIVGSATDSVRAADSYRWCAVYMGGPASCHFHTEEQCRASLSGNGGFCQENLSNTGANAPPQRKLIRR
jgi:hypothetical protein